MGKEQSPSVGPPTHLVSRGTAGSPSSWLSMGLTRGGYGAGLPRSSSSCPHSPRCPGTVTQTCFTTSIGMSQLPGALGPGFQCFIQGPIPASELSLSIQAERALPHDSPPLGQVSSLPLLPRPYSRGTSRPPSGTSLLRVYRDLPMSSWVLKF